MATYLSHGNLLVAWQPTCRMATYLSHGSAVRHTHHGLCPLHPDAPKPATQMARTYAEAEVLKTFLAVLIAGKRLLQSSVASELLIAKAYDFLAGEATTDRLPSGNAKFKTFLARPQQTTPLLRSRACHPAGVPPSGYCTTTAIELKSSVIAILWQPNHPRQLIPLQPIPH
jgi:hypothetical protein